MISNPSAATGQPRSRGEMGIAVGGIVAERYLLEELLGESGGMMVFGVTDLRLQRRVRIKIGPGRDPPQRSGIGETGLLGWAVYQAPSAMILDAGHAGDGQPFVVIDPVAPLSSLKTLRVQSGPQIASPRERRRQAPLEKLVSVGVPVVAIVLSLWLASRFIWTDFDGLAGVRGVMAASKIPNLVGMRVEDARRLAAEQGLELRVLGTRATDKYAVDVVAHQSPIGGWRAASEPLRITLSDGVAVPELRGKTLDEARISAEAMGWKIARIEYGGGAGVPLNTVSMQHPPPGHVMPHQGDLSVVMRQ